MVQEKDLKPGQPRLLAVDNELVVPVGKVVRVLTTGADVIHSFSVPAFGVKIDAIPGRVNETWLRRSAKAPITAIRRHPSRVIKLKRSTPSVARGLSASQMANACQPRPRLIIFCYEPAHEIPIPKPFPLEASA